MKPGSKDIPYEILITGLELEELQRFTWSMAESYGLDKRIEAYRGSKAIKLYRWDMDVLSDVIDRALVDHVEYPNLDGTGHVALARLKVRVKALRDQAYGGLHQ